jgi:hypothetical protein
VDEVVSNKFSLQEVLMTFEEGGESTKFAVVGGKNVRLRKHRTIMDGEEVLIVIVQDCTDSVNFLAS